MIKAGIVGYGNLGRGVERAIALTQDVELAAVFTRRDPSEIQILTRNAKIESMENLTKHTGKIDVMLLCGGSATDLEIQMPLVAKHFNFVDSFDTHAKARDYFALADKTLKAAGKTGAVCVGWDPGLFSICRLFGEAILPNGNSDTFWGTGVSQGHSDAVRRIDGVENAVQYTVPLADAVEKVKNGQGGSLSAKQKHRRVCFVVAKQNAAKLKIEQTIKTMPNYFEGYETEVNFIDKNEFLKNHVKMPHGGKVIHTSLTGEGNRQLMEFSLKLESNAEFTSSVLVAYARAVCRLHKEKVYGAKTVLDIAPSYLSPKTHLDLISQLL